jgi:ABC-type transport system involved in cytochrome c biogenesis permease subunit
MSVPRIHPVLVRAGDVAWTAMVKADRARWSGVMSSLVNTVGSVKVAVVITARTFRVRMWRGMVTTSPAG